MNTIPEEILLHIIKWIPQDVLPALALTCRRIQKCVVPQLYRFVEIRGRERPRKFLYGLPPALSPARNSDYRTQTSNWQLFTRTIEESEFLRSFVRGVAFEPKYTLNCFQVAKILEPHLQYLHLTCGLLRIKDLSQVPFVSVHLPFQSIVQRNMIGLYVDPVRDLENAFNFPNLRSLSISNFDFNNFDAPGSLNHPTGFSAVSSMSFQQACLMSTRVDDFAQLVSWPKSLQVFQISIAPLSNDRPSSTQIQPASTGAVVAALAPHATTLKELFIRHAVPPKYEDSQEILVPAPNFQQFTNLTILGLSEKDLTIIPSAPQEGKKTAAELPVLKWQLLPPKLEKLQIEVTDSNWDIHYEGRSMISSPGAIQFGDWLKALIPHKKRCCPALWNCVVWDWRKGSYFGNRSYGEWLDSLGIVTAFEQAGIKLDATTNLIPPLLSLGVKGQD